MAKKKRKRAASKDTGSDKNDQPIALVSKSDKVSFEETKQIAAALQTQLARDFAGIWRKNATIEAYDAVAPEEYRRIEITDNIGEDANGFHLKNKAFVAASADLNQVSRTCSHEMLEMLVNPTSKVRSRVSIPPADPNLPDGLKPDEPVTYLKEICDPCQSDRDSYKIDGITVCDFCLPSYYRRTNGPAFFRNDGRSREVRPGSCVTFRKEADQTWWQTDKFGDRLRTRKLSKPPDEFRGGAATTGLKR